jgi:hypothetical protein
MSLTTGDKLGPYGILAPIGAGGMGEVYEARDTPLDRMLSTARGSRVSCGQYTVNDLPTFECSAYRAPIRIE